MLSNNSSSSNQDCKMCEIFATQCFCIQESFNTKISHKFFDYKKTFVNSQHENTNLKVDFFHKSRFYTFILKFLVNKNKSVS